MMNNEPFFSCQNEECACEISYPHHMLNLWNDEPICEECYTRLGGDLPWSDLPSFVPQFQKTIESRAAEIERLREALTCLMGNYQQAFDLVEDGRYGEADEYIGCAMAMAREALKGGEGK